MAVTLFLTLLPCFVAAGDESGEEETEEILITATRPVTSASDQTVRDKDFRYYPRKSASDLMRIVPGLHITQHTGGAKAHQVFLRGFDAEHGQDIACKLDGFPLNEVSHVHGQGYLDLHFLIPEVITRIRILKGPYDARDGNFATAGSIVFETAPDRSYTGSVRLAAGMFDAYSFLGETAFGSKDSSWMLAVQGDTTTGYTHPGDHEAVRAFARGRIDYDHGWQANLLYAGYRARSQAADVVPEDWIRTGRIGRFDAMDPSNGVDVDRHLAGLAVEGPVRSGRLRATMFYNFKDTSIFSNYTYHTFNESLGDQLEQSDLRHYGGVHVAYHRVDSFPGTGDLITETGVQLRMDAIWQTQANTRERNRIDVKNHYEIQESNLGLFAHEQLILGERWMLILGMRYDLNLIDILGVQDVQRLDIVTNRVFVESEPRDILTHAHALSPKASLIYSMADDWKLFFNSGRGFVTRPARDQADRHEVLSVGINAAEVGTRWTGWEGRLALGGSVWWSHKDQELVFDSELGGTVARGQSHRLGLELEIRCAPFDWMWLGTDLFYIHGRLAGEEGWETIPNAPSLLMTNVVAVQPAWGLHVSLRGRLVGGRRHDLGLSSPAYYIVDLVAGYARRTFEITLQVENLLDTTWYDSVFAYPARPAPGEPVVTGLQVTPGTPFAARLAFALRY